MAMRSGYNSPRRHKWAQENLSAYVDGYLDEREAQRLQEHLDACPTCRQDIATLRMTKELLADLPMVEVPRSFEIPRAAVAEQKKHRRLSGVFGIMRTATVAAGALFLVTFAGSAFVNGTFAMATESASDGVMLQTTEGLPEVAEDDAIASGGAAAAVAPEAVPEMVAAAVPAPLPDSRTYGEATVELLDGTPFSEDLAQVVGPESSKSVTPQVVEDGPIGMGGGGTPPQVSAVATPEGVDAAANALSEPIVMMPDEPGSAPSRSGDGLRPEAMPTDDMMLGAGTEAAPEQVDVAALEPDEDGPVLAEDQASVATVELDLDDGTHEDWLRDRLGGWLWTLTGVFGGLALVFLAGLIWFGSLRRNG